MATHSSILAWEFRGQRSLAVKVHRVAKSQTQLKQLSSTGDVILIKLPCLQIKLSAKV